MMKLLFAAAIVVATVLVTIDSVQADCVWYGVCGIKPGSADYPYYQYCKYDGPPKTLSDPQAILTLEEVCPHFFETDNHTSVDLCCDANQVAIMRRDLEQIIGFFSRCYQCLYNFYRFICDTTCATYQSDFMKVVDGINRDAVEQKLNERIQNRRNISFEFDGRNRSGTVTHINYYLSDQFAYSYYNSCNTVLYPSASDYVVNIMCQNGGFKECGIDEFFQSTGNMDIAQVPFQMNHCFGENDPKGNCERYNDTVVEPYNPPIFSCNNPISDVYYWDDESACSCSDCEAVCPVPVAHEIVEPCIILGIDCIFFIAICIAAGAALLMFVLILLLNVCRKSDEKAKSKKEEVVDDMEPSWRQKISYKIDEALRAFFYKWGLYCATNSILILIIGLLISIIFILGMALIYHPPITDPVELWASPSSRTKQEKDYFDEHFGPFYRTFQLIARPLNYELSETVFTGLCIHDEDSPGGIQLVGEDNPEEYSNYSGIYRRSFLDRVFQLQTKILETTATFKEETVTVTDVCFKPLEPDYTACTVTSVFNYFQNDYDAFNSTSCPATGQEYLPVDTYYQRIEQCLLTPTELSCLGAFGGPVLPWVALGGYDEKAYSNATAIVITILLNNEVKSGEYDLDYAGAAKAWEKNVLALLHNYTAHMSMDPNDPGAFTFSYLTERSIEDEIERQSEADKITIVISYGVMFFYIAFALGQYRPCSHVLVNIKPTLGVAGVVIVTFSVTSSIGFYNFLGTRMTLIILEVVPFLVLAVGVDNIFIVVQSFQRKTFPNDMAVERRVAEVVSEIGPSMLLTSVSEATAFFLGALTDMPAVNIFSLYAGMAVLMNFLLQISCFISLLTLDAKRTLATRLDVVCCIKCSCIEEQDHVEKKEGFVYMVYRYLYAPVLFNKFIRPLILPLFLAVTIMAAGLIPKVGLGLDQKLSVPTDSYVLRYLEDLEDYLRVGVPTYFVVEDGYNYQTLGKNGTTIAQNAICSTSGCLPDSMINQLTVAALDPEKTKLATPPFSWLDDYYDWYKSCCYMYIENQTYCPTSIATGDNGTFSCGKCFDILGDKRRIPNSHFTMLLKAFLAENPSETCAKGGHAAYGASVKIVPYNATATRVGATNFMTYHTVLTTSVDYTTALREAYSIADEISKVTSEYGAKVFPYSLIYVYYEQYLTIVDSTILNVGVSMAAVFLISFILLGIDLWAAFILIIVIFFVIVDMLACMALWEIELNAVSLVNLVMCVGITVEFCSHIIRHFVLSDMRGRYERARHSLEEMGSSVFSGITLTKLGGIIVLGFSTSRLFQVFYFRMFLLMVVLGAAHGLIFLPILLSYFGPPSNPMYRIKKREEEKKKKKKHSKKDKAKKQENELPQPAAAATEVPMVTPMYPSASNTMYTAPALQFPRISMNQTNF